MNKFVPVISMLLVRFGFGTEDVHLMPFGSLEIRENEYCERRKGVNELVAALLTYIFRFARKSAQGTPHFASYVHCLNCICKSCDNLIVSNVLVGCPCGVCPLVSL